MLLPWLFVSAFAADLPPVDSAPSGTLRPTKDVAVVIGVAHPAGAPAEPLAPADVAVAVDHLARTVGLGSGRVSSFSDPTLSTLERGVGKAVKKVGKGGTIWVWAVGAGGVDGLATADGALKWSELASVTLSTKASRVIWVLDVRLDGAGRAGASAGAAPTVLPADDRLVVWSSDVDGGAQIVGQHGLFTWAVAGALRGWADGAGGAPPDGQVTLAEAQRWVSDAGRSLERTVRPTVDARAAHVDVVLTAGTKEVGPTAAELAAYAVAERPARVAAAVAARAAEADAALDALVAAGADPAALQAFIAEQSYADVVVRFAVVPPAVARARELLTAPPPAVVAAPVAVAGPVGCDDLLPLEPLALVGKLSADSHACLEERFASDAKITDKDKVSRLLIVDAEARGDLGRWEQLVLRHAEVIGRADPDLCLKLASWYARNGGGNEVIVWADHALENKQEWTGDAYTAGLYRVYQLKAETAYRMWTEAQAAFVAAADRNAEAAMEKLRGDAKNYAKEWMDYAFAAGRDHEAARQLCLSAAGSASFCSVAKD